VVLTRVPGLSQFGKRGDDTFALDFSHPLTPFQAFAIALSSVDGASNGSSMMSRGV
jgi:hypothetical protein